MKKRLLFFLLSLSFTKLAHAEIKDYALIETEGPRILLFGECHKGTSDDPAQQSQIADCLAYQRRKPSILIESPLPTQHLGGKLSIADTQTGSLFSAGTQSTKPLCSSSFINSSTAKGTEGIFYDERDSAPWSIRSLLACSIASWKYSYPQKNLKKDVEGILGQENFPEDMKNFQARCMGLLEKTAPTSLVNIFQKALAGHKPFSYSFEHFYKLTTYIAHIADAAFLAKILTMQKTGPVIFFGGASHTRFLRYVLENSGAKILRKSRRNYGAVEPYKIKSLFSLLDRRRRPYIPRPMPRVITRASEACASTSFEPGSAPLSLVAKLDTEGWHVVKSKKRKKRRTKN